MKYLKVPMVRGMLRTLLCFIPFIAMVQLTDAQENLSYQMPDPLIADLVDAAPTPTASISPDGTRMLLLYRPSLPSIEEVAQEELRLAGIRINPRTNSSSRAFYYNDLKVKTIGAETDQDFVGLPENSKIENVSWSPDGSKIAFTITQEDGLELWLGDMNSLQASRLTQPIINDAMPGLPYRWFSDSGNILFKKIVESRGGVPRENRVPKGPVIQQNLGQSAPVRTYQDLLKNSYDEALFEYYTTSQLVVINLPGREFMNFSQPAIIDNFSPSPDGRYVMVMTRTKPFSYIVPKNRFAFTLDIFDRVGNKVREIAKLPVAESIPKGFGAVSEGPRSFSWRSDVPATLIWVEAQDGGDPKKEAAVRDRMYYLEAPFKAEKPSQGIEFKLRYGGVTWGKGDLAVAYEWWWANRQVITSTWKPDNPKAGKTILFDRSWEDRYNDPGDFQTHSNEYGRKVLLTTEADESLFLIGQGASPEGNRPFIDEFKLSNKKSKRLWRSKAPFYERPISIIDVQKGLVITRRESTEEPPNYLLRNLNDKKFTQLTQFSNPYTALKGVQKELLKYKRADGVELTGTLYLPAGYQAKRDGRLPVLMWAYPKEFKSADAAGQVTDSPYEFIRIGWWSPLFWVTQGYAVFDDFSMPIIGEGEEEPNETFLEQLSSGAEAAVKKLHAMGVADTSRLAVGGHSYGAFMTANLLAHTDFFAAGIARSGAYNRTLTPFGFQSEERTFWETPETYFKMSPFMSANKIKASLLMIHGEADNNSGTFPMQSERMYGAMKGQGATVRLVMLPHESHSYRAKESVMHMLWEMSTWLDTYVKERKP